MINFDSISIENVQVVVLMGGLGTRLKQYTDECPKSLVKINGTPFFEYSLKLLIQAGFKKFLFLIGYKADMIEEYFGDGSSYGVSITYCYDGEELLGTGGAVRRAYKYLEDDFLLMYGDSFMDINYGETVFRYFEGKLRGMRALMTVFYNKDMFDKSNVVMKDGEIVLYDKVNRTPDMKYIDYGVCMYEKSLLDDYEEDVKFDIAEIQNKLSLSGELAAHEVTKRFYEIGSPESLKEFSEYISYRMDEKHPAVFLDRDGVINELVFNEDAEQVDSPMNIGQFVLLDGVVEAIKEIKEKGYYVFLVTNQPSAAKGKSRLTDLYDINTEFVKLCRDAGVDIDGVEMCPHYPKNVNMVRVSGDGGCRQTQTNLSENSGRLRVDSQCKTDSPESSELFSSKLSCVPGSRMNAETDGTYKYSYKEVLWNMTEGFLVKVCECRKPKSGMIKNIAAKYNIDLENSYMVGDSHTDIECGKSAGVKTVFLGDFKCDSCKRLCGSKPDYICKDLKEAVTVM